MNEIEPIKEPLESLEKYYEKLLDKDQDDITLTIGAYTCSFIGAALGPFIVQITPIIAAASASIGPIIHNIVFGKKLARIDEFHQGLTAELKRIIEDIYADNKEMKERIGERVKTDDFECFYLRSLDSCVTRERKEKVRFYQNLLIKYLISEETNIDREEIFLGLLDSISYIELEYLASLNKDYISHHRVKLTKKQSHDLKISLENAPLFDSIDENIILTRLERLGLFTITKALIPSGNLTLFGKEFSNYISDI